MDPQKSMLIKEKLPPGYTYPQITHVPISYAEFLNHFRGGHTIDDNLNATSIASSLQAALIQVAILGGHLTKAKNMAMPNESLLDITLTKAGAELIQTTLDRQFCEMAVAEAKKSIAEDDKRLHPKVGAVIVKDSKVLAKGFRGESGEGGDHGEYCALKKLTASEVEGSTVYTTLEPCSVRKSPKKTPCTNHLINRKDRSAERYIATRRGFLLQAGHLDGGQHPRLRSTTERSRWLLHGGRR
jgi:pyrimidine deaminase RibD-like protein